MRKAWIVTQHLKFKIKWAYSSLNQPTVNHLFQAAESEVIINWQLESKYLITNHKNIQSIKPFLDLLIHMAHLVCDLYTNLTELTKTRDFTEFSDFLLRKMGIKKNPLDTFDGLVPRMIITWISNHLGNRKLVYHMVCQKSVKMDFGYVLVKGVHSKLGSGH